MTPLKSSVLSAADYDEANQTLTLNFHNGTSYTYVNVPRETFRDLTLAESAGQFFQNAIRPHFQGTKVEEE